MAEKRSSSSKTKILTDKKYFAQKSTKFSNVSI